MKQTNNTSDFWSILATYCLLQNDLCLTFRRKKKKTKTIAKNKVDPGIDPQKAVEYIQLGEKKHIKSFEIFQFFTYKKS